MQIRTKISITVGLVVVLSYGITFYRTSAFQKELVFSQVLQQARMLQQQVLMTRKWVSDHNGLFVLKTADSQANPFLEGKDREILDRSGQAYVKRNPAMVTRELSSYSHQSGAFEYRITTLKPINPANSPDAFERASLLRFEEGEKEVSKVMSKDGKQVLRYISPLYVEESCMECHAHQGYQLGDIRGALSTTILVDWAYGDIKANNRMLLFICLATIVVVGLVIYLFMDIVVVRRLNGLAQAVEQYPEQDDFRGLIHNDDEIGVLTEKFEELGDRLQSSQHELDQTRERVFQSEKLAALGRLAAGVAHEVNNPLGGMLNCVKSMGESPDDPEMNARYLGLLEKGLKRVGNIVRQLLNFGRRQPVQYAVASFDELIAECLTLLEYSLKNIDLHLELQLPEPRLVDGEALQQIVVNLALNSINAMPDGGVLTLRTFEEKGRMVLEVEDSGEGIPMECIDKIYDPFFTTKEVGQGSGLGLSIVYSLVERMHGIITVASEVGRGSCFRVELSPGSQNGEE
ncbi:MAG: ATP-binding protein [Thermodesulfobacteriota bacterium]